MREIGNKTSHPEVLFNPMGERTRYVNRSCPLMEAGTTDGLKTAQGQLEDTMSDSYSTLKEVLI